MVMVMMVMMMMMHPAPPSGVSAKAMLTGEEYFPASYFCLRASSSWNDDIFDTDSFLRHKMIADIYISISMGAFEHRKYKSRSEDGNK